jgi:hypothetical protein
MGEPFIRSDRRGLPPPYLANQSLTEVVRGGPGDDQAYRADGYVAVAQAEAIVRCCLDANQYTPWGSRQDKSITTATRPKAQPGARSRI